MTVSIRPDRLTVEAQRSDLIRVGRKHWFAIQPSARRMVEALEAHNCAALTAARTRCSAVPTPWGKHRRRCECGEYVEVWAVKPGHTCPMPIAPRALGDE